MIHRFKPRITLAILGLTLALSACTSTEVPRGPSADITFSRMSSVPLNVAVVDVLRGPAVSGQVEAQAKGPFLISPAEALERYADRRMQAAGGRGVLQFRIEEARVTENRLAPETRLEQALAFNENVQYTVTMRVALDLVDRGALPTVRSAYTLERKITLPGSTSLAERERRLNQFLVQMVEDMDTALQRALRDNMNVVLSGGVMPSGPVEPVASGIDRIPLQ